MTSIRQSLFELETRHKQVCQQYEQEIRRLQDELRISRGEPPSAVRGPSPRGLGQLEPLPTVAGASNMDFHTHRSRRLDASRPPSEREREPSIGAYELRNKPMRSDGDREREYDQRDPKRRKGSDQNGESFTDRVASSMSSGIYQSNHRWHAALIRLHRTLLQCARL